MEGQPRYGQFCPVSMASEILTTRWTPIILRELMCGSTRFNELRRGVPRMSQSLLTTRLNDLVFHGLVEKVESSSGGHDYILTDAGQALRPVIEMIGLWGSKYLMHRITKEEEDPELLFWDMRRHADISRMPEGKAGGGRYVVHFEVSGLPRYASSRRFWWLIREQQEADLCYREPGYDIDLAVYGSLSTLIAVWIGTQSLSSALDRGDLRLEGREEDRRCFADWFALSPFANSHTRERLSINGMQVRDFTSFFE